MKFSRFLIKYPKVESNSKFEVKSTNLGITQQYKQKKSFSVCKNKIILLI